MSTEKPVKPALPANRIELTGFGSLWFESETQLAEYKAEPLWRRLFGRTKYHRWLRGRNK